MSTSNTSPTDEDRSREELVAYLDGELAPEESSNVERLLADDPKLRDEMVRMEKVWGALDSIPRSTVDESFTNTTVEMVAVAVEKDVDQQRETLPMQVAARRIALASIIALTMVIGFLTTRLLWPGTTVRLKSNLPVIEHIDAYLVHEGDSAQDLHEFVIELDKSGLFASEAPDDVAQ